MKLRILSVFLLFFVLLTPVQGRITGYLSFKYVKGQAQTDISHGSFQNAQFGLIFSGDIASKIDYTSEIRFHEEDRVEIYQALAGFKPSDSFVLKLGLYLVPFGKYNLSNRPHQTLLINSPLNVEKIFPSSWRDIGILVEGKISRLGYSAYIGNGVRESETLEGGQQFKDNNTDKGKGLRIGFSLSREIELGYSFYNGKYDEGNKRDLTLHGFDLTWITREYYISSEYTRGYLENPENFQKGEAEGYFIQISFDIGNLRPVVSYQWLKYEDPFHGQGYIPPGYAGGGISEEKTRWALGFLYIASENIFFKLEYDINKEKNLEIKDNTVSAQVAISF
ncbi:MAG: hypothetical protein JSV96_00745 [Candidatus Aminicenantes bacterium]|nr:MAG: hypothetical protein JSV96_00745 [Candidatus Aminicenantes bacterium]